MDGISHMVKILINNGADPERVSAEARLVEDLGFDPWTDYAQIAADIKADTTIDVADAMGLNDVTPAALVEMVMSGFRAKLASWSPAAAPR